jgi:hypothetical protein
MKTSTVFTKLWRGQYSLAAAFWGFYLGGIITLLILSSVILHVSDLYRLGGLGFTVSLGITWGYGFMASVAVWKCARLGMASPIWMNRVWAILARGVVLIWGGKVIWGLMNGGAANLMELMSAG